LAEAPSFGQPIFIYDPSSKGAFAYKNLAIEFLVRRGGNPEKYGASEIYVTEEPEMAYN